MQNRSKTGKFAKGQSGNPSGRPRRASRVDSQMTHGARLDDWQNALTGHGVSGLDARQSSAFQADDMSWDQCEALYRGDDIAARAIDTRPKEMLRQGWSLDFGKDPPKDLREDVIEYLTDLGFNTTLIEAMQFERAYGGGVILIGVNDSQSAMREVLDESKANAVEYLTVLEAREIQPRFYYTDPFSPNYGKVEIYEITPVASGESKEGVEIPASRLVHESRLIVFGGIRTSRRMIAANGGWGDSIFVRLNRVLRDFNTAFASAAVLLQDFAPAVLKIAGLAELMAMDADASIANRLKAIILARSTIRASVIDAEEEFERKVTPVQGMADLLTKFEARLAAAVDMPLTLLMGTSPGGLNATGDSDLRFFYDRVKGDQPLKLDKPIRKLVRIVMNVLRKGEPPKGWGIKFNPLWQESDKERAETRKLTAETDAIYIVNGVVSPEEIALARFGGVEYSAETAIDFEARNALEPIVPEPIGKPEPEPPAGFGGEGDDDKNKDDPKGKPFGGKEKKPDPKEK